MSALASQRTFLSSAVALNKTLLPIIHMHHADLCGFTTPGPIQYEVLKMRQFSLRN